MKPVDSKTNTNMTTVGHKGDQQYNKAIVGTKQDKNKNTNKNNNNNTKTRIIPRQHAERTDILIKQHNNGKQ